jgi:hypothetical protein
MGNIVAGDRDEVIVGSAKMLVADIGTALPVVTGNTLTWTDWDEVGFTDDGIQLNYNPTVKEIEVDEVIPAVKRFLNGEKCSVLAKLAQATLANLNRAISGSTLTPTAAGGSNSAIDTLEFGSGGLIEKMVGFEGLSPAGGFRMFIGYIATAQANVQLAFKRAEKLVIPVEFSLVADTTKDPGKQLGKIVDWKAPHS